MQISKHDIYPNPKKSPYNFEKYDSKLECWMMEKLDADPTVEKWMKRHGISIDLPPENRTTQNARLL